VGQKRVSLYLIVTPANCKFKK